MRMRFLLLLCAPLWLAGCATEATFTNLTSSQLQRNPQNQYLVEVAMSSQQQSLRWDSIRPQIVVDKSYYPMHLTPLMKNRWEGYIPVPPSVSVVHYHYKFDYLYNAFGSPKSDSATSAEYTLRIVEAQ